VAALPGSGAAELLPQARHVLATVYRDLGELNPALDLVRANLAEVPDDRPDWAAPMLEEEGDLLDRLDRDAEAAAAYESAAAGYASADALLDQVRALRKAGRSARFAERPDDASRFVDAAEAALLPIPSAEPEVAFHTAGLDYDRAVLAQDAGRPREAAQLLARAAEAYDAMGADDNAADARLSQAGLLSPAEAEPVLRTVFDAVEPGSTLWYRAGYALADLLGGLGRLVEAAALEERLDASDGA
jgi:tetratricopeptide (TPR) repeat protein